MPRSLAVQTRLRQSAQRILEADLAERRSASEQAVTCSLFGRWHPLSWLTDDDRLLMPLVAVGMASQDHRPELAYRGGSAFNVTILNFPERPIRAIRAGIRRLAVETYPLTLHVMSDELMQGFVSILDASPCSAVACLGQDSRGRQCRVSPETYLFDSANMRGRANALVGSRIKETEEGIFIVPPWPHPH